MPIYQKNEKIIRAYHTHIEVSPYELGENEAFERKLSVWLDNEFRYNPLGYVVSRGTLYIPRGISAMMIQREFNSIMGVIRDCDEFEFLKNVRMRIPPRDRIQEESIDFLTGENQFSGSRKYSQLALELDTGDGKTYSAIHAIVNLGMKALIVTHQDKIKKQWINAFMNQTTINEEELVDIKGSSCITKIINGKLRGSIYFVNHQTISSFAREYGWHLIRELFSMMKIGVKVYDEAHLAFKNILRTDMFSNTRKTFYLTANFGRSDTKEGILFKKAFSTVYQFGKETKNYEEKRKHIIYVPVLYRSNPSFSQLQMANNMYGFSVQGFSQYALHEDEERTQIREFFHVFDLASKLEGRILVTVPKIADTEFMKEMILKEYPDTELTIGTINSKNSPQENQKVKEECDVICSTIKSSGTGTDIRGLRCIINLEPYSSAITANQLSGRLREYANDKFTYFFDLIDVAFPTCEKQYKTRLSILKKKCKEIQVMKRS